MHIDHRVQDTAPPTYPARPGERADAPQGQRRSLTTPCLRDRTWRGGHRRLGCRAGFAPQVDLALTSRPHEPRGGAELEKGRWPPSRKLSIYCTAPGALHIL